MRPRPALCRHAAGEDEFLSVGRDPLAKFAAQPVRQREDPFDVGLFRPGPDDSSTRSATEQQVERVSEHRLSCPRLTREHVEPRREP